MADVSTQPLGGRRATLKDYLKHAFLYRWNMLLFLGGVVGAMVSPWPDAVLPLLAAAEGVYLAGLTSSAKFRRAVDAAVYQEQRRPQIIQNQRTLQEMVTSLPAEARRRFDELRQRCVEMRALAARVRGRAPRSRVDDGSTAALDRLLWVFLRLQVSQEALKRFLDRTRPDEIRARLNDAKKKLDTGANDERVRRSLEDSMAVQELRLDNYQKAVRNADYVRVELDRIEAKIHALTEASVNCQDTEILSSQIDSVAESMQSTEKAITELQQITGMVDELDEPPAILLADLGAGGRKR
ncbi:MAG: hypothetical protein KIT09_07455 [Bryobacteraceae bacterium]|nr:hypothetical protein [Bryobacteraceae bacterium]